MCSSDLFPSHDTPPYTVEWDNGTTGNNIGSLYGGTYIATVSDYYGDFVVSRKCTIVQPTTTIRIITDGPIISNLEDMDLSNAKSFCLRRYGSRGDESFVFTGDSIVNQTRSWKSGGMTITFNDILGKWILSNYVLPENETPGIIYSNSDKYANPPDNWIVEGSTYLPQITTTLGNYCPETPENFRITTRKTQNNAKVGSILFSPFSQSVLNEYSIDGGITFQKSPLFANLMSGDYLVGMRKTNNTGATITYKEVKIVNEVFKERNLFMRNSNLLDNKIMVNSLYDIPQISQKTLSLPLFEIYSDMEANEKITFDLFVEEERTKTYDLENISFLTTLGVNKNSSPLSSTTTITISGNVETRLTSFTSLELAQYEKILGNISSTVMISGSTLTGDTVTNGSSITKVRIKNINIVPRRGNNVYFNGREIIMNNNLSYQKPEIRATLQSKWLTDDETNEGFPFGGNNNNVDSPGTTAKVKFNINGDCLSMTSECFPDLSEVLSGPYTGDSFNRRVINNLKRNDTLNLLLDLGRIASDGNSCRKIKGTLKVIKNSGAPEELLYLDGADGFCRKIYRYIVPPDSNDLSFIWEQKL